MRDMSLTYAFDASGMLDAWFIAFKIPNLSRRIFGEGAASASFIPVYSQQLHEDPQQAKRLADTVVTVIFVLLAALLLLGWGGILLYKKLFTANPETQLILSLTSVMLPYMLLVCLVAILAGVLNVHRHFAAPAAAPIVLNIFIIASVLISGRFFDIEIRERFFVMAFAVLIAGVLQLIMQVPALRRKGLSIRPAWDIKSAPFRKIIVMMAPMIIGLTVTQINTLLDDVVAWWFSGSVEKGQMFMFMGREIMYPMYRGSVTYLTLAQRLYQLPLGVFGISLATVIFPVMSAAAAKKDFAALKKTISRGIKSAIFIAVAATVGLILVAKPLAGALFERGRFDNADTLKVAWVLMFYALGLSGFFIQQILTRAYYSMHDSKMPFYSALIAVFVNIILNLTLIWPLGAAGLALSTAICSYLQVMILLITLRRRLGGAILEGFGSAVLKTIADVLIMAAVSAVALKLMQSKSDIMKLIVVVPLAAGTYWAGAKVLKIEMLSILAGKKTDEQVKA